MLTQPHPELKQQATGLAFGVLGYGSTSMASERVDSNPAGSHATGTGFAADPCRIAAIVPATGLRW